MFEKGSVAIVTGAGPGMGRAIALGFASRGVDVVLAARRRERLDVLADEVRALGREPLVVAADLSDPDDCHAVVEQAIAHFGRLDHLVQNGHHPGDWVRIVDADPAAWKQVFDVNFFGAMHLIQAAAPVMNEGSSIVLVNSGAALRNPPTMGAYAASKAALASLVRTAALELGPKIRVNGVYLGPVTGESLDSGAEATAAATGDQRGGVLPPARAGSADPSDPHARAMRRRGPVLRLRPRVTRHRAAPGGQRRTVGQLMHSRGRR